ncbi:MAG: tRNA uridine-5-carboxymethylaminomethyl(34) synthesis GTPase MnmE [Candidatus Omnitrophica bacterium]|nr:tRNA uridine-5-carboxymethylaminomethyl(34) synthesis GTPase MnmE [Candidatus Omnitrophota bacterium]
MKIDSSGDTIAAIATAVGRGGIGVIRVSGPGTYGIADGLFESRSGIRLSGASPMKALFGRVVRRRNDIPETLDEVLCIGFRAPRSYTGEDVVEFFCHGGRRVLTNILEECYRLGARAANPGEFTQRAFLNGKMDLPQAEAVLDLIKADTEGAFRAARRHLEGKLSAAIRRERDRIAELLSRIEAVLDFPEERLDGEVPQRLGDECRDIAARIETLVASSRSARILKEGLSVVFAGAPNVGKSSLFNAFLGCDRVLVSDLPGTTRDSVEAAIELGGIELRLWDTAGLCEDTGLLEAESVRRSRRMIEEGDLILFVIDGTRPPQPAEEEAWKSLEGRERILVINKSDLECPGAEAARNRFTGGPCVAASARTDGGLEELKAMLEKQIASWTRWPHEDAWVYTSRQKELCQRSREYLEKASEAFRQGLSAEFAASDLRIAMEALGQLVGEVTTEDILDLVFSRFCIGK